MNEADHVKRALLEAMAHRDEPETLWHAVTHDPSIVLFWLGIFLIPFALAFIAGLR